MKVEEIYKKYTVKPELVGPDALISEIIARVAHDRGSRSVFVVDDNQALLGIIRMEDILNRVGARHVARGFARASDVLATMAKHLMIEPLWVTPTDDVDDALKIAVRFSLEDIPVVRVGKVVGEVDCFEMLEGLASKG